MCGANVVETLKMGEEQFQPTCINTHFAYNNRGGVAALSIQLHSTSVAFKKLNLCGIRISRYNIFHKHFVSWFCWPLNQGIQLFCFCQSQKSPQYSLCAKATPSAYVLIICTLGSWALARGDHMHVPFLVVSDCHRIKSGPNDTSRVPMSTNNMT